MPFSTACHTPLSNFEANLDYRDTVDPAVTVRFQLVDDPETVRSLYFSSNSHNSFSLGLCLYLSVCLSLSVFLCVSLSQSLLAWTTTPWTLPSNLALNVHPDLVYAKVKDTETGRNYVLLEALIPSVYPKKKKKKKNKKKKGDEPPEIEPYTLLETFPGRTLEGKKYVPLFDFYASWSDKGGEILAIFILISSLSSHLCHLCRFSFISVISIISVVSLISVFSVISLISLISFISLSLKQHFE